MITRPGRRDGGPGHRVGASRRRVRRALGLCWFTAASVSAWWPLSAQSVGVSATAITDATLIDSSAAPPAQLVHLVVSLRARTLWVIAGIDTLRTIPIAVASGRVLRYGSRSWRFALPQGQRTVRDKRADPVWTPPDWHYVEEAKAHQLRVKALPTAGYRVRDGRRLVMRDSVVGLLTDGDSTLAVLPIDEHIIFDRILFVPPVGSRNRRLVGELGRFALDLGDGYLLHGTRDQSSIGTATTHGCIRMGNADLEWVYARTAIGSIVTVR